MNIVSDAQHTFDQLTSLTKAHTVDPAPLTRALDRLRLLEHQQASLLNREVLARELFMGQSRGVSRDELANRWAQYLRIETAGYPKGSVDPRKALTHFRDEADRVLTVIQAVVTYA